MPRTSPPTDTIRRGVVRFQARCGDLVNRLVAAAIARYERHAAVMALHLMSDRDLKDIGVYRCQIGGGLDEAADTRRRQQRTLRC